MTQQGKTEVQRRIAVSPIAVLAVMLGAVMCVSQAYLWARLTAVEQQRTKERWFWELCQPGYSEADRREALSELLWVGNTEWRSARLQRMDLTGSQLAGANLQQAFMDGCKLTRAELAGSVLQRARLRQSDLVQADLSNANLFECDLLKSDLREAMFDMADLRGALLEQANAANASFVSADLSGSRLELINLRESDLRSANLADADLRLADLSLTQLDDADLSNANLDQTVLQNCNWWRSKGLTSEQVKMLLVESLPNDDAPRSLQEDFEAWLTERGSDGS